MIIRVIAMVVLALGATVPLFFRPDVEEVSRQERDAKWYEHGLDLLKQTHNGALLLKRPVLEELQRPGNSWDGYSVEVLPRDEAFAEQRRNEQRYQACQGSQSTDCLAIRLNPTSMLVLSEESIRQSLATAHAGASQGTMRLALTQGGAYAAVALALLLALWPLMPGKTAYPDGDWTEGPEELLSRLKRASTLSWVAAPLVLALSAALWFRLGLQVPIGVGALQTLVTVFSALGGWVFRSAGRNLQQEDPELRAAGAINPGAALSPSGKERLNKELREREQLVAALRSAPVDSPAAFEAVQRRINQTQREIEHLNSQLNPHEHPRQDEIEGKLKALKKSREDLASLVTNRAPQEAIEATKKNISELRTSLEEALKAKAGTTASTVPASAQG